MYKLTEMNKSGCGIFKHKKFEPAENRVKVLTNIFESSQVGINLLVAISNSGKTTYIKNLIDAIVEPFRKKKDNDLYNKLKDKEMFFFFITTSQGTDPKITKIIENVQEMKHPLTSVKVYNTFGDNEYDELREYLESTERDDEFDYPQNVVIFDDARAFLKSKNLSELATRFRHTQTLSILSVHDFKDLPKNCRDNSFYVSLFKNIPTNRLKEIYESFMSSLNSFELFQKIYEENTKDKGDFLFIDRDKQRLSKNMTHYIDLE